MMTFTCAQKIDLFRAWVFLRWFFLRRQFYRMATPSLSRQLWKFWSTIKATLRAGKKNGEREYLVFTLVCMFALTFSSSSGSVDHPKIHNFTLLLRLIWPSRPRLDWFCQHFGQLCSQGRIEIGKNFQEKNMGRWLEDEQIDITLRSFPGNEYGEMIWRWQIDTILSSFSGKEYGKMMRSSAAKLARMDFQVV